MAPRRRTVNRDVLKASSPEDLIDRVQRLAGARNASRIKYQSRPGGTFAVRFLLPPNSPPIPTQFRVLTHARCQNRGCGHPLDDHYNQYCSGWGCFCGR